MLAIQTAAEDGGAALARALSQLPPKGSEARRILLGAAASFPTTKVEARVDEVLLTLTFPKVWSDGHRGQREPKKSSKINLAATTPLTPLAVAAATGRVATIQKLVEAGATLTVLTAEEDPVEAAKEAAAMAEAEEAAAVAAAEHAANDATWQPEVMAMFGPEVMATAAPAGFWAAVEAEAAAAAGEEEEDKKSSRNRRGGRGGRGRGRGRGRGGGGGGGVKKGGRGNGGGEGGGGKAEAKGANAANAGGPASSTRKSSSKVDEKKEKKANEELLKRLCAKKWKAAPSPEALVAAAAHGHLDMVRYLLTLPDAQAAIEAGGKLLAPGADEGEYRGTLNALDIPRALARAAAGALCGPNCDEVVALDMLAT